MYSLDTNFIIEFLKGNKKAINKMRLLLESDVFVPTPVTFELCRGAKKDSDKILNFVLSVDALDLDRKSAIKAGELDAELIKKAEKIGSRDVTIAGIALTNNQILVTNDKHFSRISGLKIESY